MKFQGVFLFLLFFFLAQPALAATTVIVDKNNIGGNGCNDTWPGTLTQPICTINKAQHLISAGGTVFVRGGTYSQKVNITTGGGTANSPVTYRPYQNEHVLISGTGLSFTTYESIVTVYGINYVNVIGFEMANSSGRGLSASDANNILFQDNTVHDIQGRGIGATGTNIIIDRNVVYNTVLNNANSTSSGGWPQAVSSYMRPDGTASQNITFSNNTIYNSWGEGIDVIATDGAVVTGNRIYDTYSVLIYLDNARNVRVENNHISATNSTYFRTGQPANGIMFASEACCVPTPSYQTENITIANNLIINAKSAIRYWDGDFSTPYRNVLVYYNTIVNPTQYAFLLDPATTSGNQVKNNIIYGNVSMPNANAWVFSNNNWPNGKPAVDTSPSSFAASPQFMNPVINGSADGYKLQASSSSIGRGTSVSVTKDYFQTTRQSPSTVGFYEFTSTQLKTFIVDKENRGGNNCNDTWPGTLTQPFCTITKAITVVQPGDIIYVRAGTYPSFTSTKSGTAALPITIASYPGERAIISGGQDGILLRGTSYVVLSGFEVKGATGSWLGGIRLTNNGTSYPMHNIIENNLVHDNLGTNTYGIVAEYASFTMIKNNTVYNNYQSGINVVQSASVDPGFDLVGNQIIGNTVYGNILGGDNSDGIKTEGPRIKQTLIKDNISFGNGDDGIDTWHTKENTIIGNIAYNNSGPGDGNGFKLGGPGGGNNHIVGNIAYGNKLNGFDSNGSGGNIYYHNTAYNNTNFGFEDGWKETGCTVSSCKTTYINNIGYNNTRGNFSASAYTYASHNNLWFSDTGGAKIFYEYTPYSTLANFFTASGNRLDNPNAGTLSSLAANPLFNTDFTLQSNSPAINRGDPANPGNIPANGIPDIGAKEYVIGLPQVPGDANNDERVNAADYVIWRSKDVRADFNNDTIVDGKDFIIWLLHYEN